MHSPFILLDFWTLRQTPVFKWKVLQIKSTVRINALLFFVIGAITSENVAAFDMFMGITIRIHIKRKILMTAFIWCLFT